MGIWDTEGGNDIILNQLCYGFEFSAGFVFYSFQWYSHWDHNHRKLANLITQTTALSNSVKLSHAMWGPQRWWVMVEGSDRIWSTGEGNGKPLQYSCLENPVNSMKRQNDRILKEELPRSVGAQYDAGDQRRNKSRKNWGMTPKQKQYPAVDVTGDRSKV